MRSGPSSVIRRGRVQGGEFTLGGPPRQDRHQREIHLRHHSPLRHIGIGRRHAGTTVLVLVQDLHIRVLSTSGQLLRDLTRDPNRDYNAVRLGW